MTVRGVGGVISTVYGVPDASGTAGQLRILLVPPYLIRLERHWFQLEVLTGDIRVDRMRSSRLG